MATRLSPAGYSVERTASRGRRRADPRRPPRPTLRPVALAGLGGVYAELLRDVAVGLAAARDEAEHLLRSLRGAALLTGARGRPPRRRYGRREGARGAVDVAALIPEIAEIEVNPLLVTAEGVLGLDARASCRAES